MRAQAREAINAAYAEGLKNLFFVLTKNMIGQDSTAAAKFAAGIAVHNDAHARASVEIEKIFPE